MVAEEEGNPVRQPRFREFSKLPEWISAAGREGADRIEESGNTLHAVKGRRNIGYFNLEVVYGVLRIEREKVRRNPPRRKHEISKMHPDAMVMIVAEMPADGRRKKAKKWYLQHRNEDLEEIQRDTRGIEALGGYYWVYIRDESGRPRLHYHNLPQRCCH